MIYNISVLSNISDAIMQALRTFFGRLSALIYSLIEYLYDVFILISRAEFLDSDLVNGIYKKVGMILGIFMLFKLIFSLIQSLIEPEKFNDDKKGYVSIIKRSIIAIVLLGVTPSIFREAFNIQNLIIGSDNSNNVIYKLVVGESSNNIENMGRTIAANLYFSFYTDDEYPYYDGEGDYIEQEEKDRFKVIDYNTIVENVENKDMSFYDTVDYLSLKVNYQYIIEFNEILSILLGIVVAWMLVLYCIQAGTRVIQLGYLQLIAPIPILSYISDPEGSFKNWIKQCTSTYLDLFIRLAIIYFIMTILADVLVQFNKTDSLIMASTGLISGTFTATLVKIFIVIGLLMFAKKVPELLKELFPNMGGGAASLDFGLKSPKKMLEDIPGANKALGFAGNTFKRGVGFIDRKVHHLPKQRGKFGQAIDKLLPGHAEAHKSRLEMNDRHKLEKEGHAIYSKYGDKLSANAFSSSEFRESWIRVKNAKNELEACDKDLEYYRNEIAQGNISTENSEYQDAIRRQKAASNRLEAAKQDHENIRKIHSGDARKEDAYKYYKDMYGSSGGNNPVPAPSNNSSSSSSSTINSPSSQHNTPRPVFNNVSDMTEDGNPYENGHSQFTPSSRSSATSAEDDNPYTNPNYYNESSNSSNSNSNNDDEFDGSNYY